MIVKKESELRSEIHALVIAYCRVFDKDSVFTNQVIDDLSRFCRADISTFHPDARIHAVLEGRREVFLRIKEYLERGPDEILERRRVRKLENKDG